MANKPQPGILQDVPGHARFMEFDLMDKNNAYTVLEKLSSLTMNESRIIGIGKPFLNALKIKMDELIAFPQLNGKSVNIPSTQAALWVCIRGEDRGVIALQSHSTVAELGSELSVIRQVDGFKYDIGRDLTGYEDGTENPEDDDAFDAAIVNESGSESGNELKGSSFVAVQQWLHDFDAFHSMDETQQDDVIGRHRISNEEFDAPESAHVKRTAQESFDPEAFVVRRSMPWSDASGSGLMFVAFGKSFYAFDAQMVRMSGVEDDIEDALFRFTKPITGGYFWCPPIQEDNKLSLWFK